MSEQPGALAQEVAPDTATFESFDGTKIYYESRGQGKPVVLIHGFISNMESWKRAALYNDLTSNGFKVILIDLRGNGRSDRPHVAEAFEDDAEAMDVKIMADKLGLQKYSVVGYSAGSVPTNIGVMAISF